MSSWSHLRQKVFFATAALTCLAAAGSWGIEPLGPGSGSPPERRPCVVPELAASRPKPADGLKVVGAGLAPKIVCEKRVKVGSSWSSSQDLAKELAWHLREMSGKAVPVLEFDERYADDWHFPDETETVIVVSDRFLAKEIFGVDFAKHPPGTAFLRRKGKWFLVGGDRSGASHALTYLLEALGCRYLWPDSKGTGKVVPKRKDVVFPDLDWTYAPRLCVRNVRARIPGAKQAKALWGKEAASFGLPAEKVLAMVQAARNDPVRGNRDFFAWHGVNDLHSLDGEYEWGHAYGDYWERYHETHPEFFALQTDGTRNLAGDKRRPTFCLSCPGLVKETAANLCKRFRNEPEKKALSVSLPDAGGNPPCMCERCRRLDPMNGTRIPLMLGGKEVSYPVLSDRLVWHANAVLDLVRREFPDRRLCFYAYNEYQLAPTLHKPDAGLLVWCVCGEYSRGGRGLDTLCAWRNAGADVGWRPNLLGGFQTISPQNFARKLFDEIETGKSNGLKGTDFDCYYDQWALQGFTYYVLSAALMNPDHLSYDAVASDYFAQAFGPAAKPMRAYWEHLEERFETCAKDLSKGGNRFLDYSRSLDLDRMRGFFDEAKRLAGRDAQVLSRIAYFETGLTTAGFERRIAEAFAKEDGAALRQVQDELKVWLRENVPQQMPSLMLPYFLDARAVRCLRVHL